MNILFIIQQAEGTAHGPIGKILVNELSKNHNVDVLYKGLLNEKDLPHVQRFYSCQAYKFSDFLIRRIEKVIIRNPAANLWALSATQMIENKDYDVVICFLSAWYYYPLYCGYQIAKKTKAKYAILTVDAMPSPGWTYTDNRQPFQRHLAYSKMKYADYFSAINRQMLNYQLTTFKNKPGLRTGVTLIPTMEERVVLPLSAEDLFLYTGGIYGNRKKEYILKAFEKYLSINPSAKMMFVGSNLSRDIIQGVISETALSRIEFVGYTVNLLPYYQRAKVLINIDPDVKDDVFIASKLFKYLNVNRMILCETGHNSPTIELLGELNSVVYCRHDSNDLFRGMKQSIERYKTADYSDRNNILSSLSPSVVVEKLIADIT